MKGKKSLNGEFCNCYYQNFVVIVFLGPKPVQFQNGSTKVAIELRVLKFWSEIILRVKFWSKIILVISNHAYDSRPNCTPLGSITIISLFGKSITALALI